MTIIHLILSLYFFITKAFDDTNHRFLNEESYSNPESLHFEEQFLEAGYFEQIWNEISPENAVAIASLTSPSDVEEEDEFTFADLEAEYALGESIEAWGLETIDCGIEEAQNLPLEDGCVTMRHCILVNIPRLGWKRVYRTEVVCQAGGY